MTFEESKALFLRLCGARLKEAPLVERPFSQEGHTVLAQCDDTAGAVMGIETVSAAWIAIFVAMVFKKYKVTGACEPKVVNENKILFRVTILEPTSSRDDVRSTETASKPSEGASASRT